MGSQHERRQSETFLFHARLQLLDESLAERFGFLEEAELPEWSLV